MAIKGKLDLLAIEAFAFTPHLETAGEICLKYAKKGGKAALIFIDVANPDDNQISAVHRFLGSSRWRKVNQMAHELRMAGVDCMRYRPTWQECQEAKKVSSDFLAPIDSIHELKKYKYHEASLGLGVVSSLISQIRDYSPKYSECHEKAAVLLENAILVYNAAKMLLDKYTPNKLLTFNGRFALSKSITEAAKYAGVDILYHERGAHSGLYCVSSNSPHDIANFRKEVQASWSTADTDLEKTGAAFFSRRRSGDGIGWVSYSANQSKRFVPACIKQKRWTYFSSSDDEFEAIEGLVHHTIFQSQRHAVTWLINAVKSTVNTELVIRIHPSMTDASVNDISWWRSLECSCVTVIEADSVVDSYCLAESSDIVFSYGSTMGIEATYIGKPSILLSESDYRGFNCVYEPETVDELTLLLKQERLPPKSKESCLPYGYYLQTYGDKYKYYVPEDLFAGKWFGHTLSYDRKIIESIKTIKKHIKRCH